MASRTSRFSADDIRLYRLCVLFPGGGVEPRPYEIGIFHRPRRGRRPRRPAQKTVLELRLSLYWRYTEIIILQLLQNKDSSPNTSVQNDIILVCIFSRLRRGGVRPPVLQADDIRLYGLCTLFPGGGNPAPTRLVYSTDPVGDGVLDVPIYIKPIHQKRQPRLSSCVSAYISTPSQWSISCCIICAVKPLKVLIFILKSASCHFTFTDL